MGLRKVPCQHRHAPYYYYYSVFGSYASLCYYWGSGSCYVFKITILMELDRFLCGSRCF